MFDCSGHDLLTELGKGSMDNHKLKLLLSLVSDDSDYQVAQYAAAQESVGRYGYEVEVVYAQSDAINQSQQLLKAIQAPAATRPDVIILEPVGTPLAQVARTAAKAGIGWVVLNREVDYVAELRGLAKYPVFALSTNHLEVGRIQGRQINELLPKGGSVLYIQGPQITDAAQLRTKGMQETKHPNILVRMMNGRWTEQSAYDAVSSWLRLSTSRDAALHVVAAQNDFMAMGAR
jgi:ribose transport system substrate-binding protein